MDFMRLSAIEAHVRFRLVEEAPSVEYVDMLIAAFESRDI
jgi:hypothetical protein